MLRREVSIGRAFVILALGILTGVQGALYLYDTFDDGVSEPLSGIIALFFLAAPILFIALTFRRRSERP